MASVFAIFDVKGKLICIEYYKNEVPNASLESFINLLKNDGTKLSPHMQVVDGCNVYHVKRNKLVYALFAKPKLQEVAVYHFLDRFVHLVKDFCGEASEEIIEMNLCLVTEMMGEVISIDGNIQTTNPDQLRTLISSDAASPYASKYGLIIPSMNRPATHKAMVHGSASLFLDVLEKLRVTFKADGTLLRFLLDGEMTLKSYLTSSAEVKISLNKDLVLPSYPPSPQKGYSTGLNLNLCFLNPKVDTKDFPKDHKLTVHPTLGTETLMQYGLCTGVPPPLPFHLTARIEEQRKDLDVTLRLQCGELSLKAEALNLTMHIPVPTSTTSVMSQCSLEGSTVKFCPSEHKVEWTVRTLLANTEAIAKLKLVEAFTSQVSLLELGPATLDFEISNHTCSGLHVHSVSVNDLHQQGVKVHCYIRCVTVGESYVFHLVNPLHTE